MSDRFFMYVLVGLSLISVLVFVFTGFPFLFFFIPFTFFFPRKSRVKLDEEFIARGERVELRYCPNCGYELHGFERFCPICGMRV